MRFIFIFIFYPMSIQKLLLDDKFTDSVFVLSCNLVMNSMDIGEFEGMDSEWLS